MNKVNFEEYWNSFFSWVKEEYKNAKQSIKKEAREGYKEYCRHIQQEEIWN